MARTILLPALLIASSLQAGSLPAQETIPAAVQDASRSTVMFGDGGDTAGTGFLITDKGHVITADHVLPRGYHLHSVHLHDSFRSTAPLKAVVVGRNDHFDIAVLQIAHFSRLQEDLRKAGKPLVPLHLVDPDEPLPAALFHIGNPEQCRPESECFDIERIAWQDTDEGGFIVFASGVDQGYSGGPVVDASGRVFGMIQAKRGRTTRVLPIHSARSLLWSFGGMDIYPRYTDFRTEFTKLQRAVDDLKDQLDYLKERLDWKVSLEQGSLPIPGTDWTKPYRLLKIDYQKSFPEQYEPDGGLELKLGVRLKKPPPNLDFASGFDALTSDAVEIPYRADLFQADLLRGQFIVGDLDDIIEQIKKKAAEHYKLYFNHDDIDTLTFYVTPYRMVTNGVGREPDALPRFEETEPYVKDEA